jgi:hypothetical protein
MKKTTLLRLALPAFAVLAPSCLSATAGPYIQTNLVSDIPGLAIITDPSLKNPWGISHSPDEPIMGFGSGNKQGYVVCCYWRGRR